MAKRNLSFRPASAARAKARIFISGPAGSGKTLGALYLAQGLAGKGGRIGVIDTETRRPKTGEPSGRSEAYDGFVEIAGEDPLSFDVLPLTPPFSPETYTEALSIAFDEGFDVVVIDSFSHEWTGVGGVLDTVDQARASQKNQYYAWRAPSAAHGRLVDLIVSAPTHVICTLRSKTEYEVVGGAPKKIGLAPIQREGFDYEADVHLDCDQETHGVRVLKANTSYARMLKDAIAVEQRITPSLGRRLREWIAAAPEERRQAERKMQVDPKGPLAKGAKRAEAKAEAVAAEPTNGNGSPGEAPEDECVPESERCPVEPGDEARILTRQEANLVHNWLVTVLGDAEKAKTAWRVAGVEAKAGAQVTGAHVKKAIEFVASGCAHAETQDAKDDKGRTVITCVACGFVTRITAESIGTGKQET
jgi:hypothetical protein